MKTIKKKNNLIGISIFLLFLVFRNNFCYAANTNNCIDTVFGRICKMSELVDKIITLATQIIVPLSTLVIIAAGIFYITSTGNPDRITHAKNTIILALVSMALVLLAKAIISYLVTIR